MKKKKTPSIGITDFFGTTRNYYILGAESDLGLYPFTLKVQRFCQGSFSYLGEFEPAVTDLGASFRMMYSPFSNREKINMIILENKTFGFNDAYLLKSNKEKDLQFQTLSLFEEPFYIFNRQGTFLHKIPVYPHINPAVIFDYLILIFTEKEQNIDEFISFLCREKKIHCYDISPILNGSSSADKKRILFIQELFCHAEVKISKFLQQKDQDLLAEKKSIPARNLNNSMRPELFFRMESEYQSLLKGDPSFE